MEESWDIQEEYDDDDDEVVVVDDDDDDRAVRHGTYPADKLWSTDEDVSNYYSYCRLIKEAVLFLLEE